MRGVRDGNARATRRVSRRGCPITSTVMVLRASPTTRRSIVERGFGGARARGRKSAPVGALGVPGLAPGPRSAASHRGEALATWRDALFVEGLVVLEALPREEELDGAAHDGSRARVISAPPPRPPSRRRRHLARGLRHGRAKEVTTPRVKHRQPVNVASRGDRGKAAEGVVHRRRLLEHGGLALRRDLRDGVAVPRALAERHRGGGHARGSARVWEEGRGEGGRRSVAPRVVALRLGEMRPSARRTRDRGGAQTDSTVHVALVSAHKSGGSLGKSERRTTSVSEHKSSRSSRSSSSGPKTWLLCTRLARSRRPRGALLVARAMLDRAIESVTSFVGSNLAGPPLRASPRSPRLAPLTTRHPHPRDEPVRVHPSRHQHLPRGHWPSPMAHRHRRGPLGVRPSPRTRDGGGRRGRPRGRPPDALASRPRRRSPERARHVRRRAGADPDADPDFAEVHAHKRVRADKGEVADPAEPPHRSPLAPTSISPTAKSSTRCPASRASRRTRPATPSITRASPSSRKAPSSPVTASSTATPPPSKTSASIPPAWSAWNADSKPPPPNAETPAVPRTTTTRSRSRPVACTLPRRRGDRRRGEAARVSQTSRVARGDIRGRASRGLARATGEGRSDVLGVVSGGVRVAGVVVGPSDGAAPITSQHLKKMVEEGRVRTEGGGGMVREGEPRYYPAAGEMERPRRGRG